MNMLKISGVFTAGLLGLILMLTGFDISTSLAYAPLAVIIGFSPYFVSRYFAYTELKNMEDSFPEFLRSLSESQKSGITFPQAIINSVKIDYGPLSKEIKRMAYQLSWSVPLPKVLEKFSQRVKGSDFLRRSIAIILESYRSGGDVAEVMESVAESARLVKELESERRSKFNQQLLIMYAIYIIFIIIIVALNKILLPMFTLSASQDIGGVSFAMGTLDPEFYRTIFLHMILMQAVFAGLIAGQVGEGSIIAGVKHSAIMLAIGSLAFIFFLPAQQVIITVDASYDVFPPGSLYSLEGFVLSIDRTPLSGAEVEIHVGDTVYRTETDNLGLFAREVLLPTESGNHQILIRASHPEGRGEYSMEVSVG
jgi:archaeal flagellar protein FlaJ